MGTDFKGLVSPKDVSFEELRDKILVVDSYNVLYQFLSSIRQRDGSLLTDSSGNATSHLVGLFSRATRLQSFGIKLAFVFDGKAPKLKSEERQRRRELKLQAEKKFEVAKEEKDVEAMKKYAARTSRLTKEMVEEAKLLIEALGCPVVQAPSEGEAQAAHIVSKGKAYAVASQDYDSMIYGAPRVIRNLTITARKKQKGVLSFETITPELIELQPTLEQLGITRKQLIALAMLIGTDFNKGGIKGIGPKKGYKLVREHGDDLNALFKAVEWDKYSDTGWREVYDVISKMPVTDDYTLKWNVLDSMKLIELLVEQHDFSRQRVEKTIEELKANTQKGLGEWM